MPLKLDAVSLTRKELEELAKVIVDPFFFSLFICVIHPLRGKVPFNLYPYQKSVLWEFLNNRFNIILKFRQAGVTELISLYCLWLASYHPNKVIQIISIKDRVAKRLLRKIKYMYKNLPKHLQTPIVNGKSYSDYGTAQEIEFSNGSVITSLPTTEDAGRSEALSLLVIDEAAIVRWASQIWAAAFPTLSTGGSAILASTPYGIGNLFHSVWSDSMAGGNQFNPLRLRWQMHPERDDAWYYNMREVLGPRRTAQEIDGDFLSSGHTVFDLVDIKDIEEEITESGFIDRRLNGSLLTIREPQPGVPMFLGADVATGRARDYSAYTIMDRDGVEYEVFKGKIPTDKFADLLMERGKYFNFAQIGIDCIGVGEAVVNKVQSSGYPNLYYRTMLRKEKHEARPKEEKLPGFLTTGNNRSIIITDLESDIRKMNIDCRDPFFVQEAYTFIYDGTNRPVALGKDSNKSDSEDSLDEGTTFTDDAIMGKAICNFMRKGRINTVVIAPK